MKDSDVPLGRVTVTPESLEALAERCEREEPNQELANDIGLAVFGMEPRQIGSMHGETPNFTRSLDAAVTLVPRLLDHLWGVGRCADSCYASVGNTEGWGKTPALALCAAALRARAALSLSPA